MLVYFSYHHSHYHHHPTNRHHHHHYRPLCRHHRTATEREFLQHGHVGIPVLPIRLSLPKLLSFRRQFNCNGTCAPDTRKLFSACCYFLYFLFCFILCLISCYSIVDFLFFFSSFQSFAHLFLFTSIKD